MIGWNISKMVLLVVLGCWLVYPYISGYWLTNLKQGALKTVCKQDGRVVVLAYSELNKTAALYCLYKDARNNTRYSVTQTKQNEWSILTEENVGKGLYWPFWL